MTTSSVPSGWQVEGTAADNYQRYLVPAIFAAWVPALLEAANVQQGDRVLDVACGTGVVARGAAERVGATGRAVGLDLNAGMIDAARAADPTGSVEWQVGDAAELPFDDGTFDAAFCQQGLQFVPDPVRVAAELGRVATDGVVVVAVWSSVSDAPVFAGFAEALERHVGPEAGAIMRSPFALGDPDRLREIFVRAGFGSVDVARATGEVRFASAEHLVREEAISSPLAGPVGLLDAEGLAALVADVAGLVEAHQVDTGIAFPIVNHIVTARRWDQGASR